MNDLATKLAILDWPKVLGAGIILCALYYFVSFDDGSRMQMQIKDAQGRSADAQKKLNETQAELANAEEFRKKVTRLEEDFKKLTEALPKEVSSTDMLGIISRQAAETRVEVKNSAPVSAKEKEEFYEKTKVHFELEGSFADVVTFLSRLTGVRRMLTFEKVEIRKSQASDPERPKVQFAGVLVGYRYIPESERKK